MTVRQNQIRRYRCGIVEMGRAACIGSGQVGIGERGQTTWTSAFIESSEMAEFHIGEIRLAKAGALEIGGNQTCIGEVRLAEVGVRQRGLMEGRLGEVLAGEIAA